MMQPPPPAGCTGKAPPGAGGGAGVTLDEEVAFVVLAAASPAAQPNAKTSAAPQAPNAAAVLACPFHTTHHCSYSRRDAQNTRGLERTLQEVTKNPPRAAPDGEVTRRSLGSVAPQVVCTCLTTAAPCSQLHGGTPRMKSKVVVLLAGGMLALLLLTRYFALSRAGMPLGWMLYLLRPEKVGELISG